MLSSTDGQVHAMGGPEDDSNLSGYLYRVIDLEEADKETIHLLIFLLMQFMSRADLVCILYGLQNDTDWQINKTPNDFNCICQSVATQ